MIRNSETNRVIVRIWTSGINPVHHGEDVGHVSIEIPDISVDGSNLYISLWPRHAVEATQIAAKIPYVLHSLDDDLQAEDREPEIIYCFYTLDRHKMADKFLQVKTELEGWRLLGNFFVKKDTAESCASLAYKILQVGAAMSGILPHGPKQSAAMSAKGGSQMFKASSAPFDSSDSKECSKKRSQVSDASSYSSELIVAPLVENPDALAEILKDAKLREREKYPLTQTIVFQGETAIVSQKCLLM